MASYGSSHAYTGLGLGLDEREDEDEDDVPTTILFVHNTILRAFRTSSPNLSVMLDRGTGCMGY